MVDRALRRYDAQLYQIGKSKFAKRKESKTALNVILLINDRSKPLVCYVLSRFCNLKFVSWI